MGLTGSQRAEKVGFTYTPTNYIPVPVYSESTNKVSAHLKGIECPCRQWRCKCSQRTNRYE